MANYLDWIRNKKSGARRLYYFTSPDHLLANLCENRLKVSSFDTCNDVFELASFDLKERSVRDRHRDWVKKYNQRIGLICFSEDWRAQLMWGHYASSGAGVCLVVDIRSDYLFEVDYLSGRRRVKADYKFPDVEQKLAFMNACSGKSHYWSYEKEHRLFVDIQESQQVESDSEGRKFLKFGSDIELVGVINGPKPKLSQVEILKVAHMPKENFFQSRPSFRDFRMVVQQSKTLWS